MPFRSAVCPGQLVNASRYANIRIAARQSFLLGGAIISCRWSTSLNQQGGPAEFREYGTHPGLGGWGRLGGT